MIAVNLDKVSVTYISEPIFENLSWEIHDDRVAGLVGPNGCGKSTLLKLIHGDLNSDTGFVVRQPGLTCPRNPTSTPKTPFETRSPPLTRNWLRSKRSWHASRRSWPTPRSIWTRKRWRAIDRQARLLEQFIALGGPGYEGHVRSILHSLGFEDEDFSLPVEVLSGGQKKTGRAGEATHHTAQNVTT